MWSSMEEAMRMRTSVPVLAILTSIAGCDGAQNVSVELRESSSSAIPTAVHCGNGGQLRQGAANDRGRVDESRSDHERISIGSRANFLASLAVIADLKCKVSAPEIDDTLKPALEAARKAEANSSVYERTRGFAAADFTAHQVIDSLIQQVAK